MDSEEGIKIFNVVEEIKGYQKEIAKLKQENKQLKDKFLKQTTETYFRQIRIDKAIEYIETTNFWGLYEDTPMIDVKYGEDLLEILKGDNNGEIRYWGDNNEK